MNAFDFKGKLLELFELPRQRVLYFFLVLTFAVGMVLGLFFSKAISSSVIIISSEDYILMIFGKESLKSIIVSRLLSNFGLIVLMSITVLTAWLCPLNFLVLMYRGYIIGCTLVEIVTAYSILGVVLLIFLVIPLQFLYSLFFVSASVNCIAFSFKTSLCPSIGKMIFRIILIYLISLICILLEILIIILIVRPLNMIF